MKKKPLFYIAVLSVMLSVTLVGSVLLSQAATLTASVSFSPSRFDLRKTPPSTWKASIKFSSYYYTKNIDGNTILLEGVLKPVKTINYYYIYCAYFDGKAVKNLLVSKVTHTGLPPGTQKVELTITGKLKDGKPFEGTGTITVITK